VRLRRLCWQVRGEAQANLLLLAEKLAEVEFKAELVGCGAVGYGPDGRRKRPPAALLDEAV
jgi:hypothetical protein